VERVAWVMGIRLFMKYGSVKLGRLFNR
jgi:hypothetical protein